TSPVSMESWTRLAAESKALSAEQDIRQLFKNDSRRFERFSVTTPDYVFDYSKNLVSSHTMSLLLQLARECRVPEAIQSMFAGEQINPTEQRQALHVVLRGHRIAGLSEQVDDVLEKMEHFTEAVRAERWLGYSGLPITDIVNIGIGGSHLGPAMVIGALQPWTDAKRRCHFLSNVDPVPGQVTLARLNPATTLFVIASKSFTTLETHQNAQLARAWFLENGGRENSLGKHFVAVSSNVQAAMDFGIEAENVFPLWEWVGGRYSLWSAIGLPVALCLGMDSFRQLLAGGHSTDQHFLHTALEENVPVLMALLTVWYGNFFSACSHAILPYSQQLALLPAFLQQLSMESLGKSVDTGGETVEMDTGPIIWGAPGTDGQHSFHQLLHQGTRLTPADFIAFANPAIPGHETQHRHLLANCFSQGQALMEGKTREQAVQELIAGGMTKDAAHHLAPHKAVPGNRPSNTFLFRRLNAFTLGSLIALYEHSVYVQSAIWHINAFDQWGVELGKVLGSRLYHVMEKPETAAGESFDESTASLIKYYGSWRDPRA
ncbi:MAG: glucose-6-phosphate isomerase, partial [Pseudohongiellaceae bacterium]